MRLLMRQWLWREPREHRQISSASSAVRAEVACVMSYSLVACETYRGYRPAGGPRFQATLHWKSWTTHCRVLGERFASPDIVTRPESIT